MMHRRIAVFTGNRAEYGLLFPVLKAISIHPALDYRLVVAGAHLDPNFGRTVAEIEADGFVVHAQAAINLDGDTLLATAKAIGSGICLVADMLARLEPDLFVVYADRFEGFSALIAATQMGIPTAHIEGGDVTEGGALDDSVRHAMTKLAHLHFTTNADAARRIRAMGEELACSQCWISSNRFDQSGCLCSFSGNPGAIRIGSQVARWSFSRNIQ